MTWRRGIGPLFGAFVSAQTFLALVRSGDGAVLFWWDRAAAAYIALTWLEDLALAIAAGLLAERVLRASRSADAPAHARRPPSRGEVLVLVSAVAAGTFLRFLWPDVVPPGVWLDALLEAKGLLLHPGGIPWIGGAPLDFPGAHEIVSFPYLHFYDALFRVFGRGETGILALSALPGALTVPAAGWLAYETFGTRAAVIATSLVALSSGPLILSRWGYTPATLVPLAFIAAAALLGALRTGGHGRAVVAGLAAGLALHTHSAAVAVLAALGLFAAISFRRSQRRTQLLTFAGATLLAFLPWGWGFVQHPGFVGGRLRDVHVGASVKDVQAPKGSGLAAVPLRLAYNASRYSGFFLFTPDPNPRHTLPGRRYVNLLVGAAALVGIALAVERIGADGALPLLLLLAGGSFGAGVFSDTGGSPNTVRACVLAALGFVFAAAAIERWCRMARRLGAREGVVAAAVIATVFVFETVPFLSAWPDDPLVVANFCFDESTAGRLRARLGAGETIREEGAVRYPLVFDVLASPTDPRVPIRESRSETADSLVTRPPAEPFWFLGRRETLRRLSESGLRCSRGIAPNGWNRTLVLARVAPPR